MNRCGNMYQTVMYQYLGAYNPLSLSLNERSASSFGDVKQIYFAEAFCRQKISPLMRCRGIFPFLLSQLSPNISFILQISCWSCSAEPVQSLSLDTERAQKKVFTSCPMTTKILHTLQSEKCFLKKKKKKK